MSNLGAAAGALLMGGIAAIILAVALSAGPSAADAIAAATPLHCVTGAAAQNPTVVDQRDPSRALTLPISQAFATVEQAEAFVCLSVPYPRDNRGWQLIGVRAERSHSLSQFVNGHGYRALDISYRDYARHLGFDLHVQPGNAGHIEGSGPPQPFAAGGIEGTLWSRPADTVRPATFTLDWQQDGFWFIASDVGDLQVEDILPVLESIR